MLWRDTRLSRHSTACSQSNERPDYPRGQRTVDANARMTCGYSGSLRSGVLGGPVGHVCGGAEGEQAGDCQQDRVAGQVRRQREQRGRGEADS